LTLPVNQTYCPNCGQDEVFSSTTSDLTRFPCYTINRRCSNGHTWTWFSKKHYEPNFNPKIEREK